MPGWAARGPVRAQCRAPPPGSAGHPACFRPGSPCTRRSQLYINGEFMGGADIVEQMHNSGELKQAVQAARG